MADDYFIWYAVPLVLLFLFAVAYKNNRTKLTAGFMLSCSLVSFMTVLLLQAYFSEIQTLRLILVLVLLLVIFIMSFGVYILIGLLLLNTRSILQKEQLSLKHLLTMIVAIGLTLIVILSHTVDFSKFPQIIQYFIYSVYALAIYYFLHLTQFIITTILCNFSRPRKEQHYIIVLGSWVNKGKVTPLLMRRIDKAIEFYNRQKETGQPPKLIFSGGKGADEVCSEAEAMREYAVTEGIPEENILLEPKSTSTYENMKYSKEIMDKDSGGNPYQCIYVTNNYHVMRAGIFAREAGLKIDGIGAKTALYYLPNAILREYLAFLFIHLKRHIAVAACFLVTGCIILPFVVNRFV